MKPLAYAKACLPEFALLLVAACALSYTVGSGFEAFDTFADAALPLLALAAALLAALYAAAFNRRTLAAGVPAVAVGIACLAGVVVASGGGANVFLDQPGNAVVLGAVVAVVCLAAFAASRTRAGCAALAVAGCVACALTELLFGELHLAACGAFAVSCAALFAYRTYRLGLHASLARRASFGTAAATSVAVALLASGIAWGVFALVIEPLQPPARDLTLITKYLALEELPRRGVNQELAITDPDLTSVVVGDRIDYLEPADSEEEPEEADEQQEDEGASKSALQVFASAIGYNLDSIQQAFAAITHETVWWGWVLIVLAVVALIAAPFLVKLALRRRFYRRALALPPRDYVRRVYGRIARDFARMGLARPLAATLYEYAVNRAPETACFSANDARASFALLSHLYAKALYSQEPITEGELVAVDAFWRAFYANCRSYLGKGRYLKLFFRL